MKEQGGDHNELKYAKRYVEKEFHCICFKSLNIVGYKINHVTSREP